MHPHRMSGPVVAKEMHAVMLSDNMLTLRVEACLLLERQILGELVQCCAFPAEKAILHK